MNSRILNNSRRPRVLRGQILGPRLRSAALLFLSACILLGLASCAGPRDNVILLSPTPSFTSTLTPMVTTTPSPASTEVNLIAFPTTTPVVTPTLPRPRTSTPRTRAGATATPKPKAGATATRKYTVQAGDTLGAIARKYNVTVDALKKANGLTSDALREGQVLVIP